MLPSEGALEYAVQRVGTTVALSQARGARRREYSLISKTLHWLQPWHIPIYDSFVRTVLRVPSSWDHPPAYRLISQKIFETAEKFASEDCDWLGEVEPRSSVRGLDKYLLWLGGGSAGTAVVVKDPWRVLRSLA
jgi:hypothetical protein